MQDLPDDMLRHIFHFLSLGDQMNLSYVSLKLRVISQNTLPDLISKHLIERPRELQNLIQDLERQNGGPYRLIRDLDINCCSSHNPMLACLFSCWGLHITLPASAFSMMGTALTFPGLFSGNITGWGIPIVIGMDMVTLGFTVLAGVGIYHCVKYFRHRYQHKHAENRLRLLSHARENLEERPGDVENLIQHPELPEASHSDDLEDAQEENRVALLAVSIFNYRQQKIDNVILRQNQDRRGYGTFAGSLGSRR